MRLIDVEHIPYENGFDRENGNEHFILGIESMQEWIRQQPIITPESLVVHGKWEQSEISCEEFCCSVCGGAAWYYDVGKNIAKSRYCPNCGAKMDLEETNEN